MYQQNVHTSIRKGASADIKPDVKTKLRNWLMKLAEKLADETRREAIRKARTAALVSLEALFACCLHRISMEAEVMLLFCPSDSCA